MYSNVISKLETLIKSSSIEIYYEYLRILNVYKFFIENLQSFTKEDKLEIISFFYQKLLDSNSDIYSVLDSTKAFLFLNDKVKEKNFRLALEYFRNRTILGMNNLESIDHIEKTNILYSHSVIDFLRNNAQALDEVFEYNYQRFHDQFESLALEKEFYKIYSDSYCDIIVIKKNFFNDFTHSLFSRSGLIIRFCEEGQIGFKKDSLLLNENEALISKGICLGDYKVLTNKINYVTVHIKEDFFKEFGIDLPNYILKKTLWKLNRTSLDMLDNLDKFKNPKLLILNFITGLLLQILDENNRLQFNIISQENLPQIIKYIEDNLENNLTVSNLQKQFGLNKNTVLNIFKENFGICASKFIMNKKLEKASNLLLETNFSITEISSKFNFASASKFSLYFKEKYSLTPLQFKKKFQKLSKG